MEINKMNDKNKVEDQYKNDSALKIRKKLHKKYSKNKQGFGPWLFQHYEFSHASKILELGSGNGDMWENSIQHLSESTDLTLSDFSEGMVNILQSKYKNQKVNIKQINIEDIPFEDNSFDIVIANAMLYHVPDLEEGLSEVKRILKPGGKFYASTFGENGLTHYILNALQDLKLIKKQGTNHTFTLQNGLAHLSKYFSKVDKSEYEDGLIIRETQDLVDYISTMTIMYDLKKYDKNQLYQYLENKKGKDGCIHVPKEYGTFISIK